MIELKCLNQTTFTDQLQISLDDINLSLFKV